MGRSSRIFRRCRAVLEPALDLRGSCRCDSKSSKQRCAALGLAFVTLTSRVLRVPFIPTTMDGQKDFCVAKTFACLAHADRTVAQEGRSGGCTARVSTAVFICLGRLKVCLVAGGLRSRGRQVLLVGKQIRKHLQANITSHHFCYTYTRLTVWLQLIPDCSL